MLFIPQTQVLKKWKLLTCLLSIQFCSFKSWGLTKTRQFWFWTKLRNSTNVWGHLCSYIVVGKNTSIDKRWSRRWSVIGPAHLQRMHCFYCHILPSTYQSLGGIIWSTYLQETTRTCARKQNQGTDWRWHEILIKWI